MNNQPAHDSERKETWGFFITSKIPLTAEYLLATLNTLNTTADKASLLQRLYILRHIKPLGK